MTQDEAWESTVTKAEAKAEIELHDCDGWSEFLKDEGDRDYYKGHTILGWLGY